MTMMIYPWVTLLTSGTCEAISGNLSDQRFEQFLTCHHIVGRPKLIKDNKMFCNQEFACQNE